MNLDSGNSQKPGNSGAWHQVPAWECPATPSTGSRNKLLGPALWAQSLGFGAGLVQEVYSPPEVDRIWGIWGSYYDIEQSHTLFT